MRPVDADALRERLQNLAYDDWNQGITTSFADACHEIIDIIEEQPTITLPITTFDGITLYQCDPEKNISCKKTNCSIQGGPCQMTSKEECAKVAD